MTIDWHHLTPWASHAGGVLIGLAATMLGGMAIHAALQRKVA